MKPCVGLRHQVNMYALEALNKNYIYLDDEAVQDKWSTKGGDQFSGVGAYAEITRNNANVPKKLDKTEEEMRDFLLENPIDYRLGRGRLGMLRVHTAVEPKHTIVEKDIPFDEKPLEFGISQENVINVASVTYKDGTECSSTKLEGSTGVYTNFGTHISKYESREKSVPYVDRPRVRSSGYNVVGVRERHAN